MTSLHTSNFNLGRFQQDSTWCVDASGRVNKGYRAVNCLCEATCGTCKCDTLLYAFHSSECSIVPGSTWVWIIGSVAAFGIVTTFIYPIAGVCEVSINPNTHISVVGGLPLGCCYRNNNKVVK